MRKSRLKRKLEGQKLDRVVRIEWNCVIIRHNSGSCWLKFSELIEIVWIVWVILNCLELYTKLWNCVKSCEYLWNDIIFVWCCKNATFFIMLQNCNIKILLKFEPFSVHLKSVNLHFLTQYSIYFDIFWIEHCFLKLSIKFRKLSLILNWIRMLKKLLTLRWTDPALLYIFWNFSGDPEPGMWYIYS